MPKIPTITATGQAAVLTLRRPSERATGAAGFAQFGQAMEKLAVKFQVQRDELDFAKLVGEYGEGLAAINLDLEQNPDFRTHAQRFDKATQGLRQEMLDRAPSGVVVDAMTKHMDRTLGVARVNSQVRAFELEGEKVLVDLDDLATTQAKHAAQFISLPSGNKMRQEAMAVFPEEVARAQAGGFLSATQADALVDKFNLTVQRDGMEVLLLTNIPLLFEKLQAGEFDDVPLVERERFIEAANKDLEIAAGKSRRADERQRVAAAREELDRLYVKLKSDDVDLSALEILKAEFITAREKDWLIEALTATTEGKTDPPKAVIIENLLDAPTNTEEEHLANAQQAKELAQEAYINGTLAKNEGINMIQRANRALRGEETESDAWFKMARAFLKDKFGWQGGVVGRFLNPKGSEIYWKLLKQLRSEADSDPLMQGEKVFERAEELAKVHAVDYLSTLGDLPPPPGEDPQIGFFEKLLERFLGPDPTKPKEGINVDPAAFKGRTLLNQDTGERWRSNGEEWIKVE